MVRLRRTGWRLGLVRGAIALTAALSTAPAALAQDATWNTTPGSSDFSTSTNWTPGAVPTGFATFGNSSVTTLTFSAARNIDGFILNPGAPAYTFNLIGGGVGLRFHTDGIINNSGNAPTFNVSNASLIFDDSSTAGNAIINLNAGTVQFLSTSTAGTAQLNAATGTTFDFTGTLGPAGNGIFSAGSISGAGTFNLGALNRLVVGSNDLSTTVSGTISSGAITKVGAGTLTLSGANTYAGGTTLSSGTLMIGNSGALGSGDLSMAQGTTLAFNTAAAYDVANAISIAGDPIFDVAAGPAQTVSGIISDTDPVNNPGIVEKNGAGTLILSGANTYSGGTIINAGTLQVTNSTPNVSSSVGIGDVTLNGGTFQADGVANLDFSNNVKLDTGGGTVDNRGTTLTLFGIISDAGVGAGGLNLVDSNGAFFGTTILDGANTYTGGTTVTLSILQANNGSAVGTGAVTLDGGIFVAGAANLTFSNTFKIITNTISGSTIDNGGFTLTLSGTIVDNDPMAPGALTFQGAGKTILTNDNTYSGGTTICFCSTLQLGTSVTSGSILGAVTNEGIFDIVNSNTSGITTVTNQVGAYTIFRNSTNAGTMTIDNESGGSIEFRQTSSAANATINNNIFASTTFFNSSTAGNATINNIAGFGIGVVEFNTLSKAGTATINNSGFNYVVFNDRSTLENARIVNSDAGSVFFYSQSTAGTALAFISNNDSGQVHFLDRSKAGSATIGNNGDGILDFNNRASADNATIVNSSTIGMAFLDQSTAGNAFITTSNNSATFFFNRSDGGTARFETEAGSIVDFSGSRGPNADGKINAGSIAGAGNYFIGSGNTLSVGGNNLSTEVSGVIADSCNCNPGPGALEKVGTGTLTLSGTNTYTGGTTVAGGNLRINGSVVGAVDVQASATLSGIGTVGGLVTIQSGGTLSAGQSPGTITLGALTLNAGSTSAFELGAAGVVGGASNDLVNVTGNLTLGGTLSVNAPSAGYYRLFNYGTLTAGSSFAAITGGAPGSTLTVLTNVPNQVNLSTLAAGQRLQFWDGADMTGNGIVNGGAGTWNAANTNWTGAPGQAGINDQWRSSVGVFAGTPGTVAIIGAQAFDTLQFSTAGYVLNAGAGGQLQLAGLSGTGTLNTDNGIAATISAPIVNGSSTGLTKVGGGTLILTGANTYTGDTTISAGTLQIGNGGTTGSLGAGGIINNGVLAINRSDTVLIGRTGSPIPDSISGTGSLQQNGTGTTILTGKNTYTGGTFINAGRLQLGEGNGNFISIAGDIVNNAALDIRAQGFLVLDGVISGSGTLNQLNRGITILTAANTYTGTTTITQGTISLSGNGTLGSGNLVLNDILDIHRTGVFVFANEVSGTTGFFSQNSDANGTTTLTANNSGYSGRISVRNGTLQLGNGGTTGGIGTGNFELNIFNEPGLNAVLAVDRSNTIVLSSAIVGHGSFRQIGSGTTVLTGNNTFDGGTTISAGILQIGDGGTTGSLGTGAIVNNSMLSVNRSNGITINNTISGSGAFNQIGTGTTTLSGANTYTGATTISNGTLTIATGGSITSNVTNSATFTNAGTVTGSLTNTGTASNSGTITNGLANTSGTTTNAGTIGGGATVIGGTLTTTGAISGGLTNSAVVNANGGAINGAIVNGATFNVGGMVTSNSTFTNAASATLAVNTAGVYTPQGLLTNSGAITVANGGQLIATVGGITNNAGGTITVALGGTVKDDLNNAGVISNSGAYVANVATNTGAGTITNTATGTWTGNVASNAATIVNSGAWTGNVVSNTGTLTNNLIWTGSIANAGTFNNNAGATVSGLATNTAGTTTNNGALNGGATISGGVLTGIGTVTNLTVASGGTFVPGNGTPGSSMTITGNLAFQSGALYLVQLNPATSTFANVTGTAALNGGVGAAFLTGNYVAKQYTILTAAGGVNGTFGSFDTLGIPSGFKASLSYDVNNVFLNLDFALAKYSGLNVNQQNVANGLTNFFNATGGIPAIYGTLTPAGLTIASGELAVGSQQTSFDAMNLFLGLITDPFVAGRGDGVTAGASAPQFTDEEEYAISYAPNGKRRTKSERDAYAAVYLKAKAANGFDQRWSVWAAGYGGSQTTNGNAALGSNNATSRVYGTAVGADYRFSPNTLAGFAMAGGGTSFSVNGSGTGRSDLFQAGAFLHHTVGPAYITAALAYGWQDVTTDRNVLLAGDILRARFTANSWSGRVEGGYRFAAPWMGGVGITPYAAGQFITYDLPAYAEQVLAGPGAFALNYAAKDVTASRSELGLRSDKSFAMQNGIFTLRGRAAWAHNFNPDRSINATFQALPGASFVVNGAAQARDAALVTASAEMKWLNGFSLAATFEGEFSGVTKSYAGKGVARYAW